MFAHPEVERIVVQADGWVFPAASGGHWRAGTITRRMSDLLPDQWTAHNLRHGFATQLYEDTRDLLLVSKQLGHKSVKTTERYVRAPDDRAAEAIRRWAA